MRTSRRSRSRTIAAIRAISASCSSRRRERGGLLADLRQEARAGSPRGSAGDTRLTADDRADDLERVVEHDDVRGPADVQPADAAGRRARARGRRVAASSARSSGTSTATRLRTASIIVSALPASTPSSRRTTSSRTTISISPSAYVPSPSPAPAIASVTSASRPAATRQRRRTISGSRWTPSTIAWTTTSGAPERGADDARVAVTEGPHRVEDVGDRAHAPVEGRVGLRRGRVAVPERDRHAARVEQVDQLERARAAPAPASSSRTGPAASRRSSSAGSGSRRAVEPVRAEARGERNGPSRWTPRMRGAARVGAGRSGAPRRGRPPRCVMKVGR